GGGAMEAAYRAERKRMRAGLSGVPVLDVGTSRLQGRPATRPLGEDASILVTIVVACFNYARYLPDTLESLRAQSHHNWECIVVDDGSTDETGAVAQAFIGKDPRFRYIHQQHRGLSSARNRGIRASRGQYIQFLDADDLIESRKLERHLHYLEER